MNKLYPAFLKLEGEKALVVGGGNVAEQKINGLMHAGALVTVISPDATESVKTLSDEKKIEWMHRPYRSGDVDGFAIVIAATDDRATQRIIREEARAHRIPVNVADVPDLCSFFLGSVFREGDLTVAVSTNGKSPTVGKAVRDRIADEFSDGYPELLERVGRLRSDVHDAFPDYDSRKVFFKRIVEQEIESLESRRANRHRVADLNERATSVGQGTVFLVGAGPGDPELITVKALRVLRSADVVLYDALIDDAILAEAPAEAEKIYAGKRSGKHCMKQEEINQLLVAKASEGKRVVRLKGGDPFIFGRGGEEVEALQEAGIPVEIVPGITAGIGVPTSLGLPLTHRRDSSSVLLMTGHEDPSKPSDRIDWEAAAHVDTIVIYMGTKRLRTITEKLIEFGVSSSKPAAVIFGGTGEAEKVVTGTLCDICERAAGEGNGLPGLIVVGETVRALSDRALEPAETVFDYTSAFELVEREGRRSVEV